MNLELPNKIETIEQAKNYIKMLFNNGLDYHFDDDVKDIVFEGVKLTQQQLETMDKLQDDICVIPDFCPHGFMIELQN